jgi:hypothetical protein
MPRCSNCATVVAEGTHFCPRCGASMTAPPPDFTPPSPESPPWAPAPSRPPPYAAAPYPQAYGPGRPAQATNGMAVASLVLGIVWLFWVGSILAVVFGYVGKGQIDRSGGTQSGRGLAIAGITLGWVGVGFLVLTIVLSIVGAITDSGSSQQGLAFF